MNRIRTLFIALVYVSALAALVIGTQNVGAFSRYGGSGSCGDGACHGAFTDGTSTKGSVFPSDNKHVMHRDSSYMNADCDLCHTQGDGRDPFIGSSNGTNDNPGLGCTGCHNADGLREHHFNEGQTFCYSPGCHAQVAVGAESDVPTYYGTVDTNASDPCNSTASANVGENWTIGDFEGLDNDGDTLYDGNDPDCSATTETPGESDLLLVTAHSVGTSEITTTYASGCAATDNTIELGPLSMVSTHGYNAQVCGIGTSGSTTWSYPAGSIFFLVVGNDGSTEGSYGINTDGGTANERPEDTTTATCSIPQALADRCD